MKAKFKTIFERCEKNPLITPDAVNPSIRGFKVIGTFNPGAVAFNDEIILLLRVAEACISKPGKIRVPFYDFRGHFGVPGIMQFDDDNPDVKLKGNRGIVYRGKDYLSSISHIRLARSKNGIDFTVDDKPFIYPCSADEEYGIEDARVSFIEDRYFINYTIVSGDGWSTALSVTDDFVSHKPLGIIFCPQNKDVSIFPEKIHGKYAALHRPNSNGFGKPSIWYAHSLNLLHWGNHKCIARPRNNDYEKLKIGGGSAPIKTDKGWLCIYHAKDENSRYSLFAMLLDIDEPWKVIKRPGKPLFVPETEYETKGFFPNVVFSNGIVEKDGCLYMYYGASDQTSCLATSTVDKIMQTLL